MRETRFHTILQELTPRQCQVLQQFLAAQTDEAIATILCVEASTIRRHLANICKQFGLSNIDGEHYSYRQELIDLFTQYKPGMVHPKFTNANQPESPGSPLAVNSPFYVQRSLIEKRCAEELLKPGALIRVRGLQKMGKTSLLNRLITQAKTLGYQAVRVNLRQAEAKILTDLDSFLQWFSLNISHQLAIIPQLEDYWDQELFGSLVSCTAYFQGYLLPQISGCLVLGLDNVDWLFSVPQIAEGFFALLRSWYEEANSLDIWQKLRLIVAHSTEVYIPLNINQSPFNVGLPVRLPELTVTQVEKLAQRYSLPGLTQKEINSLTVIVGGHPYLVQLAFYHLYRHEMSFDQLLKLASTQSGIYGSILRHHWQKLQQYPELLNALKQVVTANHGIELEPTLAYRLESLGLVQIQGNETQISCQLYQQYFSHCFQ